MNIKKLLKDLTFTKGNVALDLARSSALGSVILYWGGVGYKLVADKTFDPVQVGTGLGAIFAASAAWIYYRQKNEEGPTDGTN